MFVLTTVIPYGVRHVRCPRWRRCFNRVTSQLPQHRWMDVQYGTTSCWRFQCCCRQSPATLENSIVNMISKSSKRSYTSQQNKQQPRQNEHTNTGPIPRTVCHAADGLPFRDGVLQGHQDYDLTTLGGRQAAVTAARLRDVSFWQTHSSDLVRASRTAEIILAEGHTEGPGLKTSPLLREFALGVLEDLPRGTSR